MLRLALAAAALVPVVALATRQSVADPRGAFAGRVLPVLTQRCFECHAGEAPESDLALDRLVGDAHHERDIWRSVRRRIAEGSMPPEEKARLSDGDRALILAWIGAELGEDAPPELERPVLRRLNRTQYANTLRDLFDIAIDAEHELPADDVGFGFDSIGAVLSTSDVHAERWLAIAGRVAARAVIVEDSARPPRHRVDGQDLLGPNGTATRGGARSLYKNAETGFDRKLAREGDYVVRVRTWGQQAGPDPCRAALKLEGREVARFDVPAREDAPLEIVQRVHAGGGLARLRIAFLNDYWSPDDPDPKNRDRNLVVDWIEIEGPLDPPRLSRWQLTELDPATRGTLDDVVRRMLRRVWRRPPEPDEVARHVALARTAGSFEGGVRLALEAALAAPSFLFRVEASADGRARDLTDHELAVRLSYALWSSCPDAELDALADAGKLRVNLRDVVRRMLRDPRSSALSRDFAAQWLELRLLDRVGVEDSLRAAMRAETELFFDAILREDRLVRELVDADFTFVNEELARHYDIEGVLGPALRRVRLVPGSRRGLLGHGSILTVTSNPTRTSPVKRGKFVLDNLLGAPTPPPPPGVGNLDERPEAVSAASLRERMQQHRRDPACAACHARLDPIGFALEGFDATGAMRTSDEGLAIDTSGVMPDGRRFSGPEELRVILAEGLDLARTVARKLAIYALGRGLTAADERSIDALSARLGPSATLAQLVEGVCTLDAFTRTSASEVTK